jgi:hypothetical protein
MKNVFVFSQSIKASEKVAGVNRLLSSLEINVATCVGHHKTLMVLLVKAIICTLCALIGVFILFLKHACEL